jgi:hypothetical protein
VVGAVGGSSRETAPTGSHFDPAGERPEAQQRLGWRILLTLLLLLIVALFSILLQSSRTAKAAPAAQAVSDPLVLAFYYTWFDDNTWNSGQLSDLPAERYVSADRGAMGRHIDQAKAAGIDAFIVAWYGPNGDTNQTEANLRALLEEAAARNFRIGILFETDSPFLGGPDSIAGALGHALSVHASQGAYLRADGKPVIFFWRSSMYGAGTWAGIRSQVDPGNSSLWIGEGVDTSHLTVFDGHYLYSNTWNPPADLTFTNQKFANRVAAMRATTGAPELWVATVMPGYNDVAIRPNSGFARSRDGGAYYAQSWQAAMASSPNWVVITSFNEWPEGSYIEPSAAYGDAYIGLTAQYAAQFRAGGGGAPLLAAGAPAEVQAPPAAVAEALATDNVGAEPLAELATPTAFVTAAILNLRAGPGTAFASIGAVVEGNALPIIGQATAADAAQWWQVDTVAGPAWLFGEYVRAAGPLDGIPTVAAELNTVPTAVESAVEESAPQSAASTGAATASTDGSPAPGNAQGESQPGQQEESLSIFNLRPARGNR